MKRIEIKLLKPTTKKLQLIKLIKDCSGIGLKEAKDLCDNLHAFPDKSWPMEIKDWETQTIEGKKIPTNRDFKSEFIQGLKEIPGKFLITGSKEWQRDTKLMKLGMAENEEVIKTLTEYILTKCEHSKDILEEALNKLDTHELIELIGKINCTGIEIEGNEENLPLLFVSGVQNYNF